MPPKKRPAVDAVSPVSGISAAMGGILFLSQESSQGSVVMGSQGSLLAADHVQQDSQDGSQQYSQPEYFSGDFLTPEDQVADLDWSQEQGDAENSEPNSAASSASKMCPPTPDSAAKRRKTRPVAASSGASKGKFLYELSAVSEGEDEEQGGGVKAQQPKAEQASSSTTRKLAPAAPAKGRSSLGAGAKNARGKAPAQSNTIMSWLSQEHAMAPPAHAEPTGSPSLDRQATDDQAESESPKGGGALFFSKPAKESSRRSSAEGTKVGAKACRKNPFLASPLTDRERKMPSRALPRLERGAKATRYLRDFEELSVLGKGNFGTVSLVRSRIDGQTYAVKRKEGGGGDGGSLTTKEEKTLREVWAMAALVNVPHVVRYYGAWCEDKQLFIQMEACDCNIKSRYLGKEPTAAVLLRIIDQIGSALAGMHDAGLGHLDVKPENIYCSGQDFRLGDFGLVCSQKMVQEGVEPDEGDGRYASPEAIQGFSQLEVKELAPCDVYSLGASVLELALGRELSMRDADYVRIRAGEPVVLKDVSRLGKALSCILSEMLQPSAAFRTDCREVVTQARAALAADDSGAAQEVGLSVSGGDVEMAGCVEGGGGPSSGLEGEIRELKRRLEMREKENKELEEDLQAERSRNAHLEKHLEGLNASVSSQRSDAEPQGSQESPVRCFAQPMPNESPIPTLNLSRRSPRTNHGAIFPYTAASPASAAKASPAPMGASPGDMAAPPPRPPRTGLHAVAVTRAK